MPRANRYHLPGLVWHITHRCHNKDFLFGLQLDRDRYRYWLGEAYKRYGLCLLNYIITCNHIHLLVYDWGEPGIIERSMQLTQGRIAQEYNQRKQRLGAFWQDRYHATAIQSGQHLRRCLNYIDLNMVRAGVVTHPTEWLSAGYHEIQQHPSRCRLLNLDKLMELVGIADHEELAKWQNAQILESISKPLQREAIWTSSIAVGDQLYLSKLSERLKMRARYRKIITIDDTCVLQEAYKPYKL
jgi:putative transposase